MPSLHDVLLYQSPDGNTRLQVQLQGEVAANHTPSRNYNWKAALAPGGAA